jgi:hypothetical protein
MCSNFGHLGEDVPAMIESLLAGVAGATLPSPLVLSFYLPQASLMS